MQKIPQQWIDQLEDLTETERRGGVRMTRKEMLMKEMSDILETLETQGGIYKDQADRLTEITSLLESFGLPVETIQFVEETKH